VFLRFELGSWWWALLPFCVCSALGAAFAAHFVGRLPARRVGLVLGICVLLAGAAATLQGWGIDR